MDASDNYHDDETTTITGYKQQLEQCLNDRIPKTEQIILLLDAAESLNKKSSLSFSSSYYWLPKQLPSNVKCILTIDASEILALNQYFFDDDSSANEHDRHDDDDNKETRNKIEQEFNIELQKFNYTVTKEIFGQWFKNDKRRLSEDQWLDCSDILSGIYKMHDSVFPRELFRNTYLFDECHSLHSYDVMSRTFRQFYRIPEIIDYSLQKLYSKHGQVLVQRALQYIWLNNEMNENELNDVLSLDDDVLSSVYRFFLPSEAVFRLPGTLWVRIRNESEQYLIARDSAGVSTIHL
ncbi:unnamed protein product [Didymodactylos carnosus]|uniref:Uncharacterized protein n=1 Tax=Didymodactylos carnosus TaxID=1234261 RepID=A0A815QD19_9BILA|nr:unnamed protein product [Didymodactylos carnosus]CAF4331724.1 unnamed protein product [Didymodactylos carnosus]